MKIAVVDMVRLLDQSKQGRAGSDQLRALYESQTRQLAPFADAVEKNRGKAGGPAAQRKLEELSAAQEGERAELRTRLRNELLALARPIVEALAREQAVDFVMATPAGLLYARPELDLTSEALARLETL